MFPSLVYLLLHLSGDGDSSNSDILTRGCDILAKVHSFRSASIHHTITKLESY